MSDTSKREELIERAAKALHRAAWGEDIAEPADPDYMAEMRRQAEMVIAVFEKAHTPADDERTWVTGFLLGCGVAPDRAEEYAGKLLAAGFRRTAVQEPSAAQVKARAQEYAPGRYREEIYLSEYNAAVSAFVEGATWGAALTAAYETKGEGR